MPLFGPPSWKSVSNYARAIVQYASGIGGHDSRSLEISIELPEDVSSEKLREVVKQAALKADAVHRSNGGNGLKIDLVEIFEDIRVSEGQKR